MKFEALIANDNAGSAQIEQLFLELVRFGQTLTDEQQRHVREQLTEEELVVFDLLTRPGPDLTPSERDEVKGVARALLTKVRGALTTDWHKTTQARACKRRARRRSTTGCRARTRRRSSERWTCHRRRGGRRAVIWHESAFRPLDAEARADHTAGRVHGPFSTEEEALASFLAAKKRRWRKRPREVDLRLR